MMVGRRIEALFPKIEVAIGAPVLEVRHLVAKPMTRDVSFVVHAGEIVGLAGLVGSGRSELAQALFGITPADSGEIVLNGQAVTIRSAAQARALGVAYVPEDRGTQGLVRPMSVRHNFSLAALPKLTALRLHRPRRRTAAGAGCDQAIRRQDLVAGRGGGAAVGRQPAEDRARQMARQPSANC